MAADLARFIAEKTSHNLFLTGKAGTGKTVFLRDFVAHTKKKVVVLAPTGIAAINANAMTIHSFCRFGLAPCPLGRVSFDTDYALEEDEEELVRNLELIIIDEVSMVRADVMDHISEKIRLIRNSQEPFGGVQLLLIGDLYQLPPVVTKESEKVLKNCYNGNYFFFNSNAIKKVGFETICLNKVYRQNNPEFVNILNNARVGNVSLEECNKLNTCYSSSCEVTGDEKFITLVAQKSQADEINNEGINRLDGNAKVYHAEVTDDFSKELFPTNETLYLKVGAQVMFVKNDKDGRFCNGTLGEIVELEKDRIFVKVGEDKIEVTPLSWDNNRYKYNRKKNRIQNETIGKFKQFPLKPAWAITIHKSQGLTFDNAIIDIPRAFAAGQAYVALSRCRSLEGLVLKTKLNPESFFTDPLIDAFYDNVDSAEHIDTLADAVGFVPFEWDNTEVNHVDTEHEENDQDSLYATPFDERDVLQVVRDVITTANYHIFHRSLEAGSGLGSILEEIKSVVKSYAHGYTYNPYYNIVLYKKAYKVVSKIVRERYHSESWTLLD